MGIERRQKMKKGMRLIAVMISFILMVGIAHAGDVKRGKKLFNDPRLGTNNKSCNTCHPGGKGIDGSKDKFVIMGRELGSIEDAVNFCIEFALKGKALDKNSEEMKDIAAYLRTLGGKKKPRRSIIPGY